MDLTSFLVWMTTWLCAPSNPGGIPDALSGRSEASEGILQMSNRMGHLSGGNILEVARQAGATTFLSYVHRCPWVVDELSNQQGYTVFVPTNEAFTKIPGDIRDAMNSSNQVTEWYLRYHMVLEVVPQNEMTDNRLVPTAFKPPQVMDVPVQLLRFNRYTVWTEPDGVMEVATASGAPISKVNLAASNGLVHIVDKVIQPVPTGADLAKYLEDEPKYSRLYAALQKVNLTKSLSTPEFQPLTLLAPSDSAFKKLTPAQAKMLENTTILTQVLTFHVVVGSYYEAAIYENLELTSLEGGTIYFEKGAGGISAMGQMLTEFDTTVTNGVVHELAGVMFPRMVSRVLNEV